MALTLRAATNDDCQVVFDWVNDPVSRAMSFQPDPIDWEDHQAWFSALQLSDARQLLIGNEGAERVGVVRLEQAEAGLVISINVAPVARGRGVGLQLLRAAEEVVRGQDGDKLIAFIRPDNLPSVRCFVAAGYEPAGREMQGDVEALRYVRSISS